MSDNNNPKTQKELAKWMKENCANFQDYSINGNFIYDGFRIEKEGPKEQ